MSFEINSCVDYRLLHIRVLTRLGSLLELQYIYAKSEDGYMQILRMTTWDGDPRLSSFGLVKNNKDGKSYRANFVHTLTELSCREASLARKPDEILMNSLKGNNLNEVNFLDG
ncbi:hypothetical protein WN943_005846 [Citrus x changshan-huyou]